MPAVENLTEWPGSSAYVALFARCPHPGGAFTLSLSHTHSLSLSFFFSVQDFLDIYFDDL